MADDSLLTMTLVVPACQHVVGIDGRNNVDVGHVNDDVVEVEVVSSTQVLNHVAYGGSSLHLVTLSNLHGLGNLLAIYQEHHVVHVPVAE